jgi:hypothetical protein
MVLWAKQIEQKRNICKRLFAADATSPINEKTTNIKSKFGKTKAENRCKPKLKRKT